MVEAGRAHAAACAIDSLVALGGGSSLDCAKGINFVLTNGGTMRDYWGFGKASRPMLPSIGMPTTAGTGSEAQSYAIISDADTHAKMACGDPKAAFRVVVLDPALTVSQPRAVTAIAGYDAISHAVESYVTSRRSEISDLFAHDAWRLLDTHYEQVLAEPDRPHRARRHAARGARGRHRDRAIDARRHARLRQPADGALRHDAWRGDRGDAAARREVERRARRRRGTASCSAQPAATATASAGERLAARLEALARAGGLPATLRDLGVERDALPALAAEAATQWTGTFNPRPFDAAAAQALYERAY